MKKTLCLVLVLSLAALFIPALAAAQGETLTVYASFYPMYDFAQKIAGDKARVVNMVPSGMEPHHWEPAASDIVGLEEADVFIYNGAGMEHWVDKVLQSLSNRELTVVNTSEEVLLLASRHAQGDHDHDEEHDHDHDEEHGHHHGDFDPHVWLGPLSAKGQLEAIKNSLAAVDPGNAAYYEENYEKYAAQFDALDEEFRAALAPLPRKEIVVSHRAFGYLCAAYGLTQEGIQGLTPDAEPNPARMVEIIEFVQGHGVTTIFFEELVSPQVAQTIADATGARTDVLSTLEGLTPEQLAAGEDYFSMMRKNLAALVRALQ
jgi:zinc transport system substrate-binding protein